MEQLEIKTYDGCEYTIDIAESNKIEWNIPSKSLDVWNVDQLIFHSGNVATFHRHVSPDTDEFVDVDNKLIDEVDGRLRKIGLYIEESKLKKAFVRYIRNPGYNMFLGPNDPIKFIFRSVWSDNKRILRNESEDSTTP